MAYQPKNRRKFLATSLSAAVVASAVAPTAGFAAENEFPDVPQDHNYYEVITALSEAGVVAGMPDGSFDLGGKVTRAQASQMVAKVLKLDTDADNTPFGDVKSDVWYTDSINALYAEGHIKGLDEDTFAPNKEMTRAEFAQLIVEAYEIPAKDADLPFEDVKEDVWYTDAITTLYAHGLINGQSATEFGPNDTIKRGDFAWLLANTDYQFGNTLEKPEAPTEAPVVESVSAINASHVAVKFSTEVNTSSAMNLDNYVFTKNNEKFGVDYDKNTSAAVEKARVLADGKTVVFELKEALNQGDKYGVDVKNAVKGANGESVEAYGDTQKEFKDQAAPVIQNTSYSADKTVTLYYNEPVSFDDDDFGIHIDGNEIAPEDIAYETVYSGTDSAVTDILYAVTVDVSAIKDLYAEGEHEVIIYNLRDEVISTSQAGNKIQIASTNYEVAKQEVVEAELKVEDVVGNDFNSLEVQFNKAPKNAKVTVYHGNTKFFEKEFTEGASEDITVDLPYTVMSEQNGITPLYAEDTNSTDVRVIVEDIEDENKVIGDRYEKEITLNRDSSKPTASDSEVTVAYEVDEDTGLLTEESTPTITIPLNRVVNKVDDVELINQVTVTDVNGVQRTLESVELDSAKNSLVIELSKDAGTKQKFEDLLDLKVSVKANSLVVGTDLIDVASEKTPTVDWAISENTNTLYNDVINITAVKKSEPGQPGDSNFKYIEGVETVTASEDNVITVTYTDSMTASAALIDNYSIDGKALPQGTTVSMDATSKVVTITLPEGSVEKTQDVRLLISKEVRTLNNEIIVGSITDKEMFMTEDAIKLFDNVAPLLTSAVFVEGSDEVAKTTTQLELTFSEALDAETLDELGESLVVKANGTKAVALESSVAGEANDDGEVNTVVITLVEEVTTTQKATITVDKDVDQVIEDIEGNLLTTGTVVEVKADEVKALD
jgi:hypothetical protein